MSVYSNKFLYQGKCIIVSGIQTAMLVYLLMVVVLNQKSGDTKSFLGSSDTPTTYSSNMFIPMCCKCRYFIPLKLNIFCNLLY